MLGKILYFVWHSMMAKDCPSSGPIPWEQTYVGYCSGTQEKLLQGEPGLKGRQIGVHIPTCSLSTYSSNTNKFLKLYLSFIHKVEIIRDCKFLVRVKQENVLEILEHGKYLANARYITINIFIPKSSSARRILPGYFTEASQMVLVAKNPPAN